MSNRIKLMADTLKALRGNKTQLQVAKDLDISLSAYQKYEQGTRVPRDEMKIKIADYYKKPVKSIFFA